MWLCLIHYVPVIYLLKKNKVWLVDRFKMNFGKDKQCEPWLLHVFLQMCVLLMRRCHNIPLQHFDLLFTFLCSMIVLTYKEVQLELITLFNLNWSWQMAALRLVLHKGEMVFWRRLSFWRFVMNVFLIGHISVTCKPGETWEGHGAERILA